MSAETYKNSLDLSLIIASRNRARSIEVTLSDLQAQQLDGLKWEVIVIDNGSTDDTSSVLAHGQERLPLVALTEPERGQNRARNRGLDAARGELLVFTDDDVRLSPQWLSNIYKASKRYIKYNIFCGPIIPEYPPEVPGWLRDHPFASVAFSRFVHDAPEGPLPVLPFSGNFAVRASIMKGLRFSEAMGPQGKNYAMGSETELLSRLSDQGERVVYVPSAPVYVPISKGEVEMKSLLTRAFRHGRGTARLWPDNTSRSLFGVPLYLWMRIPLALTGYVLSIFRSARNRFEWGQRFYFDCGGAYEYHLNASKPRDQQ
jgi:glycosyltransferase involved in cell wall biosynthesis